MSLSIKLPQAGIPVYPTSSLFPTAALDGAQAVAADTDSIYIFDAGTSSWKLVANPGVATAIDGLTGDVTATGPGVVPATVNFVGGETAGAVAAAASAVAAATSSDTPSTLVKRDASGNISVHNATIDGDIGGSKWTVYGSNGSVVFDNNLINSNGSGTLHASTLTLSNALGTSYGGTGVTSLGNISDVGTDGITIAGGAGSVINNVTISQHVADSTHNGYLSSTDWNTFNNKQSAVSFGTFGSSPNSDGGSISSGVITLQPADDTHPGGISTSAQNIPGSKTFLSFLTVGTPGNDQNLYFGGTNAGVYWSTSGARMYYNIGSLIFDAVSAPAALTIAATTGNINVSSLTASKLVATDSSKNLVSQSTGNLTESTSSVLTITGGTGAVVGSGTSIQVSQATTSTSGYLSSTDWNTFNSKQAAGNYITALTGDATASGPGSAALTLATVNASPGSFGSASSSLSATVNAKGLITSLSSQSIQIAESQVTNLVTDLAGKVSTSSLGNLTDVGTDGITITGGTGAVVGSVSISQHVADSTHNGYLSSTDWSTFNSKQAAGNYITALTGDVSASGPGSAAATLATVNSNTGSFGSSTAIPSFTVNGKGLITAASTNAVIAPAGTLTGTTLASNVVSSSLTSVGTLSSLTVSGAINNTNLSASQAVVTDASKNLSSLTYTSSNIGSTIVSRDSSGNFSGDTISAGTAMVSPLVAGGSIASSTLTLESTSGAGTTDKIVFKTGSQVTAATINTSGNLTVGGNGTNTSALNLAPIATVANAGKGVASVGYAGSATFFAYRAQGTEASPTAIANTNSIANFLSAGYDGTSWTSGTAGISMSATETWSSTAHGTNLLFQTTAAGSTTLTTRATLNESTLTLNNVDLNIRGTTTSVGSAWTSYTPTIGAGSGTITTSTGSGLYQQLGKIVFFQIKVAITTNGTGASFVTATLPVATANDSFNYIASGMDTGVSNKMLLGLMLSNSTTIRIYNYDGTYPGANGASLMITGHYQSG